MISQLAKIPTLYLIGKDPWNKKRVNYLSFIEGKGMLKDIKCHAICLSIKKHLLVRSKHFDKQTLF
jgi:hypothetical protein